MQCYRDTHFVDSRNQQKMEIPLCIMWQCECNAIKAIRFKKSTKYCCHHVQFIERKYLHYNVVGIILKY
jgi:hypothetical protein